MNRPAGSDEVERAARRGAFPVRIFRLGEEPGDDLRDVTTPEERIAMMWPLAVEAWRLSGRPMPDYARSETPVRLLRGRERDSA